MAFLRDPMTLTPLLFALPWLGLVLFVAFRAHIPSELPAVGGESRDAPGDGSGKTEGEAPLVSVIVPARNEEANIEACLRSIAASDHPRLEVIVVDDRSEDGTASLARSVARGNAERIEVVEGRELPPGWLGKPWACHQGAALARGDLLLFTDADTIHGPDLIRRAVVGLRQERADLLTVVGRQLMESFWERVVQPQVFFLMLLRFPDVERAARNDRWRDAIANGQFLLFTRDAYQAIGGHEAVRDEVVEDLALAQVVKRAGLRLRIRSAEDSLATRMYRSLGHLVAGWSKNMLMGGLQSTPPVLRPVLPPIAFVGGFVLWLLAPLVLLAGLIGVLNPGQAPGPGLLTWAAMVVALSLVLWSVVYHRMGAGRAYAFTYPLAAAVFAFIFLRSWMRGRHVEWKGRRYELRSVGERP